MKDVLPLRSASSPRRQPAAVGAGPTSTLGRGTDPRPPERVDDLGARGGDADLEQLRSLLLGDERAAIIDLQRRLEADPRADAVANVLPASLIEADRTQAPALIEAMRAPVVEAMSVSARRETARVSEALAPVIGPAIVRAISDALKRHTERVEALARNNLTVQGVKWRLEAKRRGISFADVVLEHTLLYRVEEIFLVHAPSGLLIAHAAREDVQAVKDKDAVVGMMSAIQSFAQDSLGAERADRLQGMDLGGRTLQLTQGPHAMIASLHRGKAPLAFFDAVQSTLDELHARHHHDLRAFDGSRPPAGAAQLLEPLLVEGELHETKPKPRRWRLWISVLLLAGIAALVWRWADRLDEAKREEARILERLRADHARDLEEQRTRLEADARQAALQREQQRIERGLEGLPGLIVSKVQPEGGAWRVVGLLDPLGPTPAEVAERAGVSPAALRLDLRPFLSLEPTLVLKRAAHLLEPPPTVRLELVDSKLVASGTAPAAWLQGARSHARMRHLPFVTDIDLTGVTLDVGVKSDPQNKRGL